MSFTIEKKIDPQLKTILLKRLNTKSLTRSLVKTIESLDLSEAGLNSAQGLEYFINLRKLNISHNLLTDCSFLLTMDKLIELDLSFNHLESIPLIGSHLNRLNVRNNRLTSIEWLRQAKQLIHLNIRSNNISNLEPIKQLTKLETLNCRSNHIKSLDPLMNLHQLKTLNIRNNRIRSITPLINLRSLNTINLRGNSINNLTTLTKIGMPKKLDVKVNIESPLFSQKSGHYKNPFHLRLTTEEGYDIFYTIDGSVPNKQANKYVKPIEVSQELMNRLPIQSNIQTSPLRAGFNFTAIDIKKAIMVRAIAYDGKQYSPVNQAMYILKDDVFHKDSLPLVSLSIDPKDLFDPGKGIYVPGHSYKEGHPGTGNYYVRGRQTEKNCFVEIFTADGKPYLSQAMGVRINGGFTRRFPQKSLRLYARSHYGQSKIYPLLFNGQRDEGFKRLVLRNAGDDHYSTMIRDGLMHELIRDRNIDVQAYRPVNVLINGEYWGIHNVREKFTKHYLKKKYHLREKDFTILKIDPTFKDGTFKVDHGNTLEKQDYHQFISFVEQRDLNDDENFKYVDSKIDIKNFLMYVAIQVYYANTDSFANNLMVWRKRVDNLPDAPYGHDGRWRYLLYDLDWGMGYGLLNLEGDPTTFNMLDYVLSERKEMTLFRRLMTRKETKQLFIKVILDLLNTNFAPQQVKRVINRLAGQIRPAIELSIKRWENIDSIGTWELNIIALHEFAKRRPEIVRRHLAKTFNITI